jgi:hypothetical protein
MDFSLHPRQTKCFISEATEILYGGSAGGGKSFTMRAIAIYYAMSVPNIQVYLFRRLSEDLKKNHLDGSGGFIACLSELMEEGYCKINYSTGQIIFWNGAKIHLCHCQHEKDVIKYQGVEINVLLIDELTHFTEYIYKFLRGRVRLGGLKIPNVLLDGKTPLVGELPRIICGSNPGGIGHEFCKSYFIDNAKPLEIRRMPKEKGGMLRQFIPAKLADNPTMLENDPLYADKLLGLGGALAKAMLDGDWDAIEGAYFDRFDRDRHIIEPFIIPSGWTKIRGFDWGYSAPFCSIWVAISDGSILNIGGENIVYPRDSMIVYKEFYGTTGKPNEGLKMDAGQIAEEIRALQGNDKMDDQVADPAIFDVSTGTSIADQMADKGVFWRPADNKRVPGWQQIRRRLVGIDNKPLIYFFDNCKNLIRTLPNMQYSRSKPEDLDTAMEDHAVDTLRYICMSRPLTADLPKPLKKVGEQWRQDFNPHNVLLEAERKRKRNFE